MRSNAEHDAPYWCEENAWHLCVEPRLGADAHVVVISNPTRTVALWQQRAAPRRGVPVVWDYHVIVASRDPVGGARVWDLDTMLGFPVPIDAYLAQTFCAGVDPKLLPRFRVLAALEYRARFASDRRHMRDADGGWQQPPPPWPPIGEGHVLDALLDTHDSAFGPWLGADALRAQLSLAP